MATSTCPKCESTRFELKQGSVIGAQFILYFIQCAKCGAVVGVQPFHNTASLLKQLAKKLGKDLDV